jgi:DNA (cytosine-5)-methyltransferase 1
MDDAPLWSDARTFDGKPWRGVVDCLIAGYPCQPFSRAGKRKGVDDPRHLWPHIARIIEECRPWIVFLENVSDHLNCGFQEVRDDLRGMGYRVEAGLFTAAEAGDSQLRQRLFILAINDSHGRERTQLHLLAGRPQQTVSYVDGAGTGLRTQEVAHALDGRSQDGRGASVGAIRHKGNENIGSTSEKTSGFLYAFPPSPDAIVEWQRILDTDVSLEPAVCGVVDGRTSRVDELRALGNGVLPVVAAYAFVTLAEMFDEGELRA